jgi:MGT family glycosyltransferase
MGETAARHVVLCTIPGYGHITPVLDVVAELVALGARVTVATGAQFAEPLEAAGAEIVRYAATESGDTSAHAVAEALAGFSGFLAPLAPVLALLAEDPADVLVFDSTMWLGGRVLAHGRPCATIQLSPCFASNEAFSLPERVAAHMTGAPAAPAPDGGADLAAVLGAAGMTGDLSALLNDERDRKLVFLPREFQYAGDTFDDRHVFVGPCLGPRRLSGAWDPPPDGHPLLLVSLGTSAFNDQPDFFRSCADAFDGLPWNLVLTLGGGTDPAALEPLPHNVRAHRWLPHPAVLVHARAFVCPAGMGSIMEALSCATPLVVVPQHGEQEVNAERVVELGLGRRIARDAVTPELIRDTVLAVATDPGVAGRVQLMSGHCRDAGGHRRAAEEILTAVPATRAPSTRHDPARPG